MVWKPSSGRDRRSGCPTTRLSAARPVRDDQYRAEAWSPTMRTILPRKRPRGASWTAIRSPPSVAPVQSFKVFTDWPQADPGSALVDMILIFDGSGHDQLGAAEGLRRPLRAVHLTLALTYSNPIQEERQVCWVSVVGEHGDLDETEGTPAETRGQAYAARSGTRHSPRPPRPGLCLAIRTGRSPHVARPYWPSQFRDTGERCSRPPLPRSDGGRPDRPPIGPEAHVSSDGSPGTPMIGSPSNFVFSCLSLTHEAARPCASPRSPADVKSGETLGILTKSFRSGRAGDSPIDQ